MLASLTALAVVAAGPVAARADESPDFDRAMRLYAEKKFPESERILRRLVKARPDKALYWFNLGNIFYMTDRFDLAEKCYRRVLALPTPLRPAAQLYLIKALRGSGKTDEALQLADDLLKSGPGPGVRAEAEREVALLRSGSEIAANGDDGEERALAEYREGRFAEALRHLERKGRDLSEEGQLLRSLTLIRLERAAEAKRSLKRLARRARARDVRRDARALLLQLDQKGVEDRAGWLYFEATGGYNSNVYLSGASVEDEGANVNRLTLGAGYRHDFNRELSARLSYVFSWEEVSGHEDLRVTDHVAYLPLAWEKNASYAGIGPAFRAQAWGGQSAFTRAGARARYSESVANWDFGADAEAAAQSSASGDYDYLKGTVARAQAFAGLIRYPSYFQTFLEYGREDIGDLDYTDGSRLPLAHSALGGGVKWVYKWSDRVTTSLLASATRRQYEAAALPSGKKREDDELSLAAKASWAIDSQMILFLAAETLRNRSTLGADDVSDKNYRVVRCDLGFSWDVF